MCRIGQRGTLPEGGAGAAEVGFACEGSANRTLGEKASIDKASIRPRTSASKLATTTTRGASKENAGAVRRPSATTDSSVNAKRPLSGSRREGEM